MEDNTNIAQEVTLEEIKNEAANVQEEKAKSGLRVQLIVFKLAGEEYAISIDHIKEVVLTPGVAKIPQAPDYIKGVANIRGNIIAIMDLEDRFNLNGTSEKDNMGSYTLVIESDQFKVGILVKEVPNTLNTFESEIDSTASIMQYSALDQECIQGVVKVGEKLVMLVDVFKLMEMEDLSKISNI